MSEPVQPPDPTRRRFFRQFAGDVVTSVGSVVGAAQSLQETSAETARELLGVPEAPPADGGGVAVDAGIATGPEDAASAGWRAPFRWDGDVCRIVDQRRLPDHLVDLEIRGAADTVTAINDGALVGSPVQAQVAAVTLALLAGAARTSRAFARRATIRGAANALRNARPGSAAMGAVLDRMLALAEQLGLQAEGTAVEAALRAEAEAIIGEAVDDHGALVGHLLAVLPGAPDEALRVLVAGSTGAMAGGQFGTALSAVQTVHHSGRTVHALVAEGRPGLEGSRIAAWELRQAGVGHSVVTDAAAPGCVANGEVQVVLVAADRVCANGDVVCGIGAYPLALACAASGVPFVVCAATPAVDLRVADGAAATTEEGRPASVLRAGGTRVAPEGTAVRNPQHDVVAAALVSAIVTEMGVHVAPFGPALAVAVDAAAARRAASPGFAALVEQRAREAAAADDLDADAEGAGAPGSDAAAPATVDVAALRARPPEPSATEAGT